MAIFNCKSCGGDLEIKEGATVVTCEYCGRQQTVPSMDNEKKVNLFNRANRLRSKCDFDKAASVYESIVAEFPQESEAYWGLCLCKFGIEYVDDPGTAKKIPTCHRTSYESIFDDQNFDMACENADALAVNQLRSEAKEIDRLQKEILEIAKYEQPFDVFICYKESDETGGRTVDSELAHDIYDVLTEKGYKVFYSRITLKAKLGQDYEPYIFSALNSAKVMLSIGTKFEYFNAVWVKNEWSRFLSLMKSDKSKMLIPCYRDIDPYDMPKEFSGLQGQDLSSPRAFQDLVTNIERIIPKANVSANAAPVSTVLATDPLVKRAFMCLEDGDWSGADKCCEKILDADPENARAYFAKLCLDLKVKKPEYIAGCDQPLDENINFKKVLRFGDKDLKDEVNGYNKAITDRVNANRKNAAYNEAVEKMNSAKSADEFKKLKEIFLSLGDYKDSVKNAKFCDEQLEILTSSDNELYDRAVKYYDENDFEAAEKLFKRIPKFKDTQEHLSFIERVKQFSQSCKDLKAAREKDLAPLLETAAETETRNRTSRAVLLSCSVWACFLLIDIFCVGSFGVEYGYLFIFGFVPFIITIVISGALKAKRTILPNILLSIASFFFAMPNVMSFPFSHFIRCGVLAAIAVIYYIIYGKEYDKSFRACEKFKKDLDPDIERLKRENETLPDKIKESEAEKIFGSNAWDCLAKPIGNTDEYLNGKSSKKIFIVDLCLIAANIILLIILMAVVENRKSAYENDYNNGYSSSNSQGQSGVNASVNKASQLGDTLLNINGSYTFYNMTVSDSSEDLKNYCKISPGNCEDYFFAYNHDYSAYSEILIVKPKTDINSVQSFQSEFNNYFDYVKNVMETPVFSQMTLSVMGAVHGVTDDGYYYMLVHEDGTEIAANVFGSSSIASKAAADYSILNDLLYTRVGDIISQSTVEESDKYSDNMTYKGYYISIATDRYGGAGDYYDRLPVAMSFPINMIVSGDCDYTYAGLKEVFGDKLVLTSYPAAENPYGVDAYGMTIKWNTDIILYNESGEKYFDTDLTGRVKSCWLDCQSFRHRFKPDMSNIEKILYSTIGQLKSECENITKAEYGYNMTYHGTEIYVGGGTPNHNDMDERYPMELEFPIEFLINGKKDYSWAELMEIFQNDLATDIEENSYAGTTTYRVSARIDGFLIFFINDSSNDGVDLKNLNPFNKCRYYYF